MKRRSSAEEDFGLCCWLEFCFLAWSRQTEEEVAGAGREEGVECKSGSTIRGRRPK